MFLVCDVGIDVIWQWVQEWELCRVIITATAMWSEGQSGAINVCYWVNVLCLGHVGTMRFSSTLVSDNPCCWHPLRHICLVNTHKAHLRLILQLCWADFSYSFWVIEYHLVWSAVWTMLCVFLSKAFTAFVASAWKLHISSSKEGKP